MKKTFLLSVFLIGFASLGNAQELAKKHLFILSGQSNMARLDPKISFTPTVSKVFGKENVIVVKEAQGGQPIRRWLKEWKSPTGETNQEVGDLYEKMFLKIKNAITDIEVATVTFVWMQGETDARKSHGSVYEDSLLKLYNQLSSDLNRTDVNFVIGRLSDFDMDNAKYADWTMIRNIQEKVAASNPRFAWIDTDDLNTGLDGKGKVVTDDLHMSISGYRILGTRFAKKAIELIETNK